MVHWYGLPIPGVGQYDRLVGGNQVKGHGLMEAVVGSVSPATLDMWGVVGSDTTHIFLGLSMPVTIPPVTRTLSLPLALQGVVGLLGTMSTVDEGIVCSDFQLGDTGTSP